MTLAVFSHKLCWRSPSSPSGFATDGGFALQMRTLSDLFDRTRLVVPCDTRGPRDGEIPISGRNLDVVPLEPLVGSDFSRKLRLPSWLFRNVRVLMKHAALADAVHAVIPGDIGTLGMVLALARRQPLFVRHCGNWFVRETAAEHFWTWAMQTFAGGRNVMLATGGAPEPPSKRNTANQWIFSTTLTEAELAECRSARASRTAPPPGSARLVIACRQERRKGTGVVIESLPGILEFAPRATLDVVGDGEDLNAFKALAGRLGVADRVRFHGKVNHRQVMGLLADADLFCYPTCASEGFPKVVLEAMASGLPVITTPVSVLPELMRSGGGRLIEAATPEAVQDAVRSCLADPQGYDDMSSRARDTAQRYSLERWRETIGRQLEAAWGPLQSHA